MNKYQESLDNFWLAINCNVISFDNVIKQDLATLQELVNKEIPMKVTDIEKIKERFYYNEDSFGYEDVIYGTCPRCGKRLSEYYRYCSQCGQRLDWSDSE